MIFNWEDEFREKLVLDGIDLEDNVYYLDRSLDALSGCVVEDEEDYWIYVELDDNFNIKSIECDCGKDKCHHMTALLHVGSSKFKRDIEYGNLVDNLDTDRLMEFLKEQIEYNDEIKEEFKDKFLCDFINDDEFSLEDKLFLILDDYDWAKYITDYVKGDLTQLYEDGHHVETFYLITEMFDKVIFGYTFEYETKLKECYSIICELLEKISKSHPQLIRQFLKHCSEHNYHDLYPSFAKLADDLNEAVMR